MAAPALVSGRPSATSTHRRPSALLDSNRTRRVSSGSTTNGTLNPSARSSAAAAPTISASSSSASSKLASNALTRQGPASTAASRAKTHILSTSSPSPPRKVRNPLGPVPNLPSLPAPPSISSTTTTSSNNNHLGPAAPPSAPGSSTGALSGAETDEEGAKLMRASKKRPAPDSFDVRAGGGSAVIAAAVGATAAAAAGKRDANGRSAALTVRSDFHIGSSTAASSARTSTTVKSRLNPAKDAAVPHHSTRPSPPTSVSSHMDPDELALGAGPLPARRVSPVPSSAPQPNSNPRGLSPENERPISRRTFAIDAPNPSHHNENDPLARRRARENAYLYEREPELASSKGGGGGDTESAASRALLRPVLKRIESSSSNGSNGGGNALVPGRSRSDSGSGRSESPLVRTPLESIPESELGGAASLEARRRRREEDEDLTGRDNESTLRYGGNARSGLGQEGGGGGGGYDRDLPNSTSPTSMRPSPTRTTRFAPLPPSHSGDRLAAERELRRGRASSDAEREGSSGGGKGMMRPPPPLTRSLASFDDLRGSVPLASHGFASTLNTGLGPHGTLQLHSTPAPPSRMNGTNSTCALCGHGAAGTSDLPARKLAGATHALTGTTSPQPSPSSAGPFLTQADLADAMARVTDVLESRLADIQLDVLRSARQSRNAILDGVVRAIGNRGGSGNDGDQDGEDVHAELQMLREENRKLRALLGEGRGSHFY
ncbi:hypothetical protein CF327_g4372 [Tilletia walkeri]|nr:hypothetical protein CF327_g4372 [Tilletia walkeri]